MLLYTAALKPSTTIGTLSREIAERLINDTHPAAAQLFMDFVVADRTAFHVPGFYRETDPL